MFLAALVDAGLEAETLRRQLALLDLTDPYEVRVEETHKGALRACLLQVDAPQASTQERHLDEILTLIETSRLSERVKQASRSVFQVLAEAEARVHGIALEQVHFHEVGAVDSIVDIVGAAIGLEALGIDRLYASPLPVGSGQVQTRHGLLPLPAPATLEILSRVQAPAFPSQAQVELVTPTGAAILATLARFEQPQMVLQQVGIGAGKRDLPWPNVLRLMVGEPFVGKVPQPCVDRAGVSSDLFPSPGASRHPPPKGEGKRPLPRFSRGRGKRLFPSPPGRGGAERTPGGSGEGSSPVDTPATGTENPPATSRSGEGSSQIGGTGEAAGRLVLMETNIDDMNPQAFGHVMNRLLAAGALDVYLIPIYMKKNRPATLLGVIARQSDEARLARLILEETSTLGVRVQPITRYEAERDICTVQTEYGEVPLKRKILDGRVVQAAPEYDACARLADQHGVPFNTVYHAALRAYENI